jgi:hypothetical protein
MDWMWTLFCGLLVGLFGMFIFYKFLQASNSFGLSTSFSRARAAKADAGLPSSTKADMIWMLGELSKLQNALSKEVHLSSVSPTKRLHPDFPRPKQVNTLVTHMSILPLSIRH